MYRHIRHSLDVTIILLVYKTGQSNLGSNCNCSYSHGQLQNGQKALHPLLEKYTDTFNRRHMFVYTNPLAMHREMKIMRRQTK